MIKVSTARAGSVVTLVNLLSLSLPLCVVASVLKAG